MNTPLTLRQFRICDRFFDPIRETVRTEGIPYQWKALNDEVEGAQPSHCIRNFRIAAGAEQGGHRGFVFQDSDVAKWLEGVAYSLVWHPDPELEALADAAIDVIVAAQQPDGYLDTYYIITGLDKRFTNLMDNHELYCAGHMLEASIAYFEATGKRRLLDAMLRFIDHIDGVFGPEEGKCKGYPGHPVIEMALMRLYELTRSERHLKLAKFFIDQRGQSPLYFDEECKRRGAKSYFDGSALGYAYYQAHKPVREQHKAEGHAVRALYLYAGMTDVARETGDQALLDACHALWQNVTRRQMYITGAVGSSHFGESFTFDYDLPNDTVYGETCASIALIFWAQRMLRLAPRGEYADALERALYNTVLAGMQLDGKRFFYVNPLEVRPEACERDQLKRHVRPERQPWFSCACCPPNLIRLIASLENYVCCAQGETVYWHQYVGGTLSLDVHGTPVALTMQTDYPWDGRISLSVCAQSAAPFTLALRVPGWCRQYTLRVNGEAVCAPCEDGFLRLARLWQEGDRIELSLSMPVCVMRANPRVAEDAGKIAVTRGPLVYCLEEADNGKNLHLLRMAADAEFTCAYDPDMLGGVCVLTAPGTREADDNEDAPLYAPAAPAQTEPAALRFIPYYAWANRGVGEMRVFVRRET